MKVLIQNNVIFLVNKNIINDQKKIMLLIFKLLIRICNVLLLFIYASI
jgi:hypothetical protein